MSQTVEGSVDSPCHRRSRCRSTLLVTDGRGVGRPLMVTTGRPLIVTVRRLLGRPVDRTRCHRRSHLCDSSRSEAHPCTLVHPALLPPSRAIPLIMSFLPQSSEALLSQVTAQLCRFPHLHATLTVSQLWTYINVINRFLPLILLSAPRATVGLPPLHDNIRQTLMMHMHLPPEHVLDLWTAIGPVLLLYRGFDFSPNEIDRSLAHIAPSHNLGGSYVLLLSSVCMLMNLAQGRKSSRHPSTAAPPSTVRSASSCPVQAR